MAWQIGDELVLSETVRQNLPFIRGAIAQGMKAQETYDLIRSIGSAGRKQTFLDAYRAMSYAYQDPSIYLPSDTSQKPLADLIPMSLYTNQRRYTVTVDVPAYNTLNNQLEQKTVTIISDDLYTQDDYFEQAFEYFPEYGDLESIQFDEAKISSILYSDNPIYG